MNMTTETMPTNNHYKWELGFCGKRVMQMLWIDMRLSYGYVLLSFLAPLAILLIIAHSQGTYLESSTSIFKAYIWIGGLIFASYAFSEAHKKPDLHEWFMLPASTLEKFLSRFLLTSVAFGLLIIIASSVTHVLVSLSVGNPFYFHQALAMEMLTDLSFYSAFFFWHALFLLGSATFKKWVLVKTLVIFSIISLISVYVLGTTIEKETWMLFFEHSMTITYDMHGHEKRHVDITNASGFSWFVWGMIPLLWVATYLKLKNLQAKNGI